MNIAMVGTGYVGLVSGTCFAEMGVDVTCVDTDAGKVEGLRRGIIPIYEPGLEKMVAKNVTAGRLRFTTDLTEGIDKYDIIFCAVGTPPGSDGAADLAHVLDVARTVGRHINGHVLFVTKSTVPVGTGEKVEQVIAAELSLRGLKPDFDVASNPEFLKEGAAINDFMHPDRVVIGVGSDRARQVMERLYKPFTLNDNPLLFCDIRSAEMIKYASNAMLATRISFMNDIANLSEMVGADIDAVRAGIGSDPRIGSQFIYPGIGYGGSCFPKDVKALIHTASTLGYDMRVLRAVESVNESQKQVLFNKFRDYYNGDIKGRRVAMWGLSFKPETDDMREAPSIVLATLLADAGCEVRVYDPVAMDEARKTFGDSVSYFDDKYEAVKGADALMMVTEWKEFRLPDWGIVKNSMRMPLLLDGRNIYDGKELSAKGFDYIRIGGKP